ncbi:hypothetical protein VA7868_03473 [Vibrio aerogenes CECT 7868]|uniref:Lon protease n=1 Tax=Vibrio aerogenes CECT 7868 TaxID=1216006 RepID=A0A1M6A4D1_9VIBR|nr:hypothetical protein [Vibrio aerogenes]SHI31374.1 hypothetical protein VA7868_03473 [Vibrio aerogenes CECT 7868]
MLVPASQSLHLPFLMTTDHLMPAGKRRIWGSGLLFSQTLLEATKQNGLWLVMQDSDGQAAMSPGDIVIQARVLSVDWLSAEYIDAEICTRSWGNIIDVKQAAGYGWLTAQTRSLWPTEQRLSPDELLVIRFQQWLKDHHNIPLWLNDVPANMTDPNQLCWYWLELLPLPVSTKQRLLRQPTSQACLRYLKKIFWYSDRFRHDLR